MASIEKRTTQNKITYRVKIRIKGCPVQTASFNRLTDAKRWAQQTESAIREGRHFKTVESKRHTFDDLVTRYCSEILPGYSAREQVERKSKLEWWRKGLGYLLLADVIPSAINEYKSTLNRSNATQNRYLAALSHLFSVAVSEWEWAEDNPVKKIKKSKESRGRVRFLSDDERDRLLQACKESSNDWLYMCAILALSTGMRQGELMGLKWQDVFLSDGFLILHETKNNERRRIPISGKGLWLLKQHSRIRRLDTDLLFPSRNPGNPVDLRQHWITALKLAEINDFRWHDLRHSCASYLAMNGASLAEISEILGHKTLQMVKRYSHLSDSHVSNVLADMNEKLGL